MAKRAASKVEKAPRRRRTAAARVTPAATPPAATTARSAGARPGTSREQARKGRTAGVHDAALTLFAKLGYHGTSMKDIAAAVRMRAPSLYNHVAAKQDLLRDVILHTHEIADRELRAAIGSSTDVAEQLRRATEVHVRFHTSRPREWRVASRDLEHLEEPARTSIRKMRKSYEELVIGIIERGVAEGRFDVAAPKLAAYAIFRMSAGVAQWYRPGGEFSDSEIAYCFGDLALRMVGVRTTRRRADRPGD